MTHGMSDWLNYDGSRPEPPYDTSDPRHAGEVARLNQRVAELEAELEDCRQARDDDLQANLEAFRELQKEARE